VVTKPFNLNSSYPCLVRKSQKPSHFSSAFSAPLSGLAHASSLWTTTQRFPPELTLQRFANTLCFLWLHYFGSQVICAQPVHPVCCFDYFKLISSPYQLWPCCMASAINYRIKKQNLTSRSELTVHICITA